MKTSLRKDILNKNVDLLNEFLAEKGMSLIVGGKNDKNIADKEPEWGNTNYAESTRPIKR